MKNSVAKYFALGAIALACAGAFAQTTTAAATAAPAPAVTTTSVGDEHVPRLTGRFTSFAGSDANAVALIEGLRSGTPITLGGTGSGEVTITPPTGRMGWGNVRHALDLAKAELAAAGVANPSPEQIRSALVGGTLDTGTATSTLPGVLSLRAQGMGWGKIEKTLGVKRPSGHGGRAELAQKGGHTSDDGGRDATTSADATAGAAGERQVKRDSSHSASVERGHSGREKLERPARPEHAEVERVARVERVRIERPDSSGHGGKR